MKLRLPNNFAPRPYQVPPMAYFDAGGKRAICVWHRRGGKDLVFAHQTCKQMHRRKGAYWHVFPTGEQGRKALWEGFTKDGRRIMEAVFPSAIRKSPKEFLPKAEMVVELKCGSIWRLLGSDKIEVVGAGPVGVVFSEYAVAKPSAWNFIAPMLDENEGWAAFITTPRGNNHAKKLFDSAGQDKAWFRDFKTLYDTRAYNPDETIAAARARGMPEALIRQEYLCDWTAALVGSVFGDCIEAMERDGRLAEFTHPNDGIFTSWDLGFTDATAIWFWRLRDGGVEFVDWYEAHGRPLSHYFDVLEEKRQTHGYAYVKHWLPHDARARTLATGSSILDQFLTRYGSAQVAIGPALSLLDGIQATRWLLQQNTRIHPRCGEGIEALRAYSYEYDEDKKTFAKKPLHSWASHTSDALRYAACVVRGTEALMRPPAAGPKKPAAVPLHNTFTLEELWEANKPAGGGRI